jgi:hypothetical protein
MTSLEGVRVSTVKKKNGRKVKKTVTILAGNASLLAGPKTVNPPTLIPPPPCEGPSEGPIVQPEPIVVPSSPPPSEHPLPSSDFDSPYLGEDDPGGEEDAGDGGDVGGGGEGGTMGVEATGSNPQSMATTVVDCAPPPQKRLRVSHQSFIGDLNFEISPKLGHRI